MVDHGFRILCASEQSYSPKEAQPTVQTCRNQASRTVEVARVPDDEEGIGGFATDGPDSRRRGPRSVDVG
jgi:hypothetical protein